MPSYKYGFSVLTAALFVSPALGAFRGSVMSAATFGDGAGKSRELAIAPSGYGQVGQTLFGVVDSIGTDTGSSDVAFGSNIAISDDGLRMAVGSSRHDYLTKDADPGSVNNNGGAVFIYDYNGTAWVYKNHIVGATNEQLGKWPIDLSADGQVLTIRRGGSHPRSADVYSVDAAGTMTQLGGSITCGAGTGTGTLTVALTKTAGGDIRLASGCANAGDNGEVHVLDFNSTSGAWQELTPESPFTISAAESTDGRFGMDAAWALEGTRLAISAPDYSYNATEDGGMVRVLDFNGSSWNQIGQFTGDSENEKFGFSIDLSSDGSTLVIGAPNNDVGGNNTGAVFVYSFNAPDSWSLEEEIRIEGAAPGAGFGRGIHVSSNGSVFCAATADSYNDNRGQLRVFDLSSGSNATELADFQGLSGDKIVGVAMTNDGSRLALGSIGAQVNGIVQVFDDGFTPVPSLSPSLAPSASPAPTIEVPVNPTDIGTFDWDLFSLPDLTSFTFTEDSETSEIQLHYNISIRDTTIQAFETDCTTPIPSDIASLTKELTNVSSTHGDFVVDVNIHQDNVTSSPIWEDVGVGEGRISMCVRVDLTLPAPESTSVTFHEQKLFVSIDLIQGFEITGIQLDRLNATENNGSADFDYEVTACHCNETRDCVEDVLTQGSDVYLCIETTAPNVEIEDVRDLTMAQGEFYTTPIDADGVEDPLTETTIDGKEATIRYQIISAFFSDPSPDPINATGSVLLAFTDDDGRRLRRSAKVVPRRQLEQEEGFAVRMLVESAAEDSSGAFTRSMVGVGVGVGILAVLAIVTTF